MNVPEKLWQHTTIANTLSIFPGVLGEFLQQITPQAILRAEKFLPHIFWRWYMLEHTSLKSSPYYYLEWKREREHWPSEGQFFPKSSLSISKTDNPFMPSTATPQVKIDITVDYISFNEQPFLVDCLAVLQGKPMQYPYDNSYVGDVKQLAAQSHTDNLSIKEHSTLLISNYLNYSLSVWRRNDPFITKAFSEKDWLHFWKELLHTAAGDQGLSTDNLLDIFVERVRIVFPAYGIKSADLEQMNTKEAITDNIRIQYFFWLSCARYVLLPFSLYTHLLAPIFIEHAMFHEDIKEIINKDFTDPMPIYAPFTTLTVTPFGKRFLSELSI